MAWTVVLHEAFEVEMHGLDERLKDELLAHARLLQQYGPLLGRPTVDALNGSRYANTKELRFGWKRQAWRVAFALDPRRRAVLLAAGDKRGTDTRRFYRNLISTADARFEGHLATRTRSVGAARGAGRKSGKKS